MEIYFKRNETIDPSKNILTLQKTFIFIFFNYIFLIYFLNYKLLLSIFKMSLYDGTENDINIAGFKTTNIALKNTPQQNPKEYKTRT